MRRVERRKEIATQAIGELLKAKGIDVESLTPDQRKTIEKLVAAVHSITRWSQDGWSYEKMLPMLTAYMGNVREKGFLRYFELTPSRYRA